MLFHSCTILNGFFSHIPDSPSFIGQTNLFINKRLIKARQPLGLSFVEEEEGWQGTKYLLFRKAVMIFFSAREANVPSKESTVTPLFLYFQLCVNNHPLYQKLLISLKYAILTGFGTFLSISTPSPSKYFFLQPCQNL